ncbi:MAG TPA: hypothetical protein VGK19_18300 [Capsulimonadaceae bacterium]
MDLTEVLKDAIKANSLIELPPSMHRFDNMILTDCDDRNYDLFKRAWTVLPATHRTKLLAAFNSTRLTMTINFTADWAGKALLDGGARWTYRPLIQYDINLIREMPDEVALVLITHELAHEYLAIENEDHEEVEAMKLNHTWHVHRQFPRRKVTYLEDVGENLLSEWAARHKLGDMPQQVLAIA